MGLGEKLCTPTDLAPTLPDSKKRADQRPHHRPAERIGGDERGQHLVVAHPVQALQVPDGRRAGAVPAERGEIVQSEQLRRRRRHGVDVLVPQRLQDVADGVAHAAFPGLDAHGQPQVFEMGCYGIGVTRILGAAIEQNHDERGIIWPDAIAPFTAVVCPIGMDRSEAVKIEAERIYNGLLEAGVDVILDDRGERPGAMFADWELIGVPHRITIGDKGLKDGLVEYQHRRDAESSKVAVAEILAHVKARLSV